MAVDTNFYYNNSKVHTTFLLTSVLRAKGVVTGEALLKLARPTKRSWSAAEAPRGRVWKVLLEIMTVHILTMGQQCLVG